MLSVLIAVAGALALAVAALWVLGAREPVYRLHAAEGLCLVALRLRDPSRSPQLAAGARLRWSLAADFGFIASGLDAWWQRILLVSAPMASATALPVLLDDNVLDAQVLKLSPVSLPRLALGLLRARFLLGITRLPAGELITDPALLGGDPALLPTREAVATLLERPAEQTPEFVNFLRYRPLATGSADETGAAAYNRYGRVALKTVYGIGGRLALFAHVDAVLRAAEGGPTQGAWDDIAVMHYPAARGVLMLERFAEYRAALAPRDAGLLATVVISALAD